MGTACKVVFIEMLFCLILSDTSLSGRGTHFSALVGSSESVNPFPLLENKGESFLMLVSNKVLAPLGQFWLPYQSSKMSSSGVDGNAQFPKNTLILKQRKGPIIADKDESLCSLCSLLWSKSIGRKNLGYLLQSIKGRSLASQ